MSFVAVLRAGTLAVIAASFAVGSSSAQVLPDPQLIAVPAAEASLLAEQISDSSSSQPGDTKGLQSFQNMTEEAAALLEGIATASLSGQSAHTTRPLFDEAELVISRALRLSEIRGIAIDPTMAAEFAQRLNDLRSYYRPAQQ